MEKGMVKRLLAAVAVVFCGAAGAAEAPGAAVAGDLELSPAEARQKIYDFLKEAKCYYIATVDKDQPHVRPFGTILIYEDHLYIQTGRKKNVGQQLLANGKVELCAMKDNQVLRVTGTLVEDPRREAKAAMLDAYPGLKKMYSPDDDNTMVLYFKDGGSALLTAFGQPPVTFRF